MSLPLSPDSVNYDTLVERAHAIAASGGTAHLHTTPPGCIITGSRHRAIVLEVAGQSEACAWFSDEPIEALARPLAILLHGAESVPENDEDLEPACPAVEHMAGRMLGGYGHFHILDPKCQVNPHPGQWTILFEDRELGTLESVSDERPLADVRYVEQLIYR
jgi:hypothetical protein